MDEDLFEVFQLMAEDERRRRYLKEIGDWLIEEHYELHQASWVPDFQLHRLGCLGPDNKPIFAPNMGPIFAIKTANLLFIALLFRDFAFRIYRHS